MAMQKHPELPDVPLITGMVSREVDQEALPYLYATQEISPLPHAAGARRWIVSRRCDGEGSVFLEDARRSNQEVDAVSGRRVQEIVEDLYKTPRQVIDKVEALRAIK